MGEIMAMHGGNGRIIMIVRQNTHDDLSGTLIKKGKGNIDDSDYQPEV
jgi:hypothetical protein